MAWTPADSCPPDQFGGGAFLQRHDQWLSRVQPSAVTPRPRGAFSRLLSRVRTALLLGDSGCSARFPHARSARDAGVSQRRGDPDEDSRLARQSWHFAHTCGGMPRRIRSQAPFYGAACRLISKETLGRFMTNRRMVWNELVLSLVYTAVLYASFVHDLFHIVGPLHDCVIGYDSHHVLDRLESGAQGDAFWMPLAPYYHSQFGLQGMALSVL